MPFDKFGNCIRRTFIIRARTCVYYVIFTPMVFTKESPGIDKCSSRCTRQNLTIIETREVMGEILIDAAQIFTTETASRVNAMI